MVPADAGGKYVNYRVERETGGKHRKCGHTYAKSLIRPPCRAGDFACWGKCKSRTYTENDIAAILGIGRASAYKLANSGLFKTIRIGNMIRISRKSFEDWLKVEDLEEETE